MTGYRFIVDIDLPDDGERGRFYAAVVDLAERFSDNAAVSTTGRLDSGTHEVVSGSLAAGIHLTGSSDTGTLTADIAPGHVIRLAPNGWWCSCSTRHPDLPIDVVMVDAVAHFVEVGYAH